MRLECTGISSACYSVMDTLQNSCGGTFIKIDRYDNKRITRRFISSN